MPTEGHVYRFGPFELDSSRRCLTRGGEEVWLPERQMDVLLLLVANAGQIVSKRTLSQEAWKGLAVTDNSAVQAVRGLRETLGEDEDTPYIETLMRRGYRFIAAVTREPSHRSVVTIDELLAPFQTFVDGRAAFGTLNRHEIARACQGFEEGLRIKPDYAPLHIGMANARILAFEATRVDAAPDVAALRQADHHARKACELDGSSGDAWGTLAIVLNRIGAGGQAVAAARKAVDVGPKNWLHYFRLAYVSWGEERLRAADRVLAFCPGLAFAYMFTGTVFIARQAFGPAVEALRAGCAAQDAQPRETAGFHALGLRLFHGHALTTQGADDEAIEEYQRELALEDPDHIYARECTANTWYAVGAIRHRQGRPDAAAAAFQEALTRVPGHPLAAVGLAAISGQSHVPPARHHADIVDAAMGPAAALVLEYRHDDAARLICGALGKADPGSAGWILPAEPLFHVTAHRHAWAQVLAMLRDRAT